MTQKAISQMDQWSPSLVVPQTAAICYTVQYKAHVLKHQFKFQNFIVNFLFGWFSDYLDLWCCFAWSSCFAASTSARPSPSTTPSGTICSGWHEFLHIIWINWVPLPSRYRSSIVTIFETLHNGLILEYDSPVPGFFWGKCGILFVDHDLVP